MSTLKSAQLDIYIYDSGQPPSTPQYSLSKSKLATEDTINFEISELIKDYVDVEFSGDHENAKTTKLVDTVVTRTFTDTCTEGTKVTHQEVGNRKKYIAFRGYGELEDRNNYTSSRYFDRNINPTLSKDLLISNVKIYHLKGEPIRVPSLNTSGGAYKVEYQKDAVTVAAQLLGGDVDFITADLSTVTSDVDTGASQLYTADVTHIKSNDSSTVSKEEVVTEDVTAIKYTTHKGVEFAVPVELIEECKQTPYRVTFLNKYGALQDLWFFKKRTDQFEVQRENYNRTLLTTSSSGVDFSRFAHSSSLLDVTGTEKATLNTGFISEDHNQVIKELMVTEFCWILEANHAGEEPVPVKPITSSFNSKTVLNDKLINFTIEFEYANSYIQNVR